MSIRHTLVTGFVVGLAVASASAQDGTQKRGRKYKAPPETSHIEVLVLKDANQKPISNAAVVFHSVMDGKDEGNLEVKTNEDGKASIDVIPTGSNVDIQVIADGLATFAGQYVVTEADRKIEIRMIRPRAQISAYVDTRGQAAQRPVGVQEPIKQTTPPVTQPLQSPNKTSDPNALAPGAVNDNPSKRTPAIQQTVPLQTNPSNVHPDNQYPLDPATAPKTPASTPPTSPAPPQR